MGDTKKKAGNHTKRWTREQLKVVATPNDVSTNNDNTRKDYYIVTHNPMHVPIQRCQFSLICHACQNRSSQATNIIYCFTSQGNKTEEMKHRQQLACDFQSIVLKSLGESATKTLQQTNSECCSHAASFIIHNMGLIIMSPNLTTSVRSAWQIFIRPEDKQRGVSLAKLFENHLQRSNYLVLLCTPHLAWSPVSLTHSKFT